MEAIGDVLARLGRDLPVGATLDYEVRPGELFLAYLCMPRTGTGLGTRVMAAILAEADARGLPVTLQADPSDEPGNPSTFELVRWYGRFGFEATGMDDDEWIVMARPATPPGPDGAAAVLARYEAARGTDLDEAGFRDVLGRIAPGLLRL